MELKKSSKANLEETKHLFREIGFVVALILLFGAFEYSSSSKKGGYLGEVAAAKEESEMIAITREPEPPKPVIEKPPVEQPRVDSKITETDDKKLDDSGKIKANDDDIHAGVSNNPLVFEPIEPIKEQTFKRVQKMPVFNGGDAALLKFLADNLEYPQEAIEIGLEGTVVIEFVVGKDGKAKDPKVFKSLATLLDKSAIEVISKLPLFKPGEQFGEKVSVYYKLPIEFKLAK